jgi:diguanylate cyclase (GGDEF)-like protein
VVTVSVGVAELPQHGTSPKELLESADAALYRAKNEGRDRVIVAEAPVIAEVKST